jgi:hypothetical protein
MFKLHRKQILLAVLCAFIIPASEAIAARTTIDATANFLAAMVLGNERSMDFGNIEFSRVPGSGDSVLLATNGSVSYEGSVFSGRGNGNAGSVEITAGAAGRTVEVHCDANATLSNGNGGEIVITDIEISTTPGAFGAGIACNGVNTQASFELRGQNDVVLVGGRLDGSSVMDFTSGSYSTANDGGSSITIDILYQ